MSNSTYALSLYEGINRSFASLNITIKNYAIFGEYATADEIVSYENQIITICQSVQSNKILVYFK